MLKWRWCWEGEEGTHISVGKMVDIWELFGMQGTGGEEGRGN